MTDVLALDDEIVCKEEERDEYGPMHTDEYEVKEWILEQSPCSIFVIVQSGRFWVKLNG